MGKFFAILVLSILLSGCFPFAWEIHIPDDISNELPDLLERLRSQVTSGETSRQEVHERLGQPFIGSERRRVEIFRAASGREGALAIAVVIPTFFYTEDVIVYALVLYDDNDVVEAIEWDVYRDVYTDDYLTSWRAARLQTRGFFFVAAGQAHADPRDFSLKKSPTERTEMLLAPVSETLNAVDTPQLSARCAVLVFVETVYWDAKAFLVGEFIGGTGQHFLPFLDPYGMVFTKVLVVEGEHELTVTTVGK